MVLVIGEEKNPKTASLQTPNCQIIPTSIPNMDKAWGVTVAPLQQHKRHDPWHKHDLGEKEKAKHIRKLILCS